MAAAAVILPARAADAAPPAVFWVSASGSVTPANASCQTARYNSVQSAVNAAESYESSHPSAVPAIEVCPGTYSEQVTIDKSLALSRAPVPASQGAAVIQLPSSVGSDQSKGLSTTSCQANDAAKGVKPPQSVIEICGATTGVKVAVTDLIVEGNWPGSVCYDSLYGILVGGGASLTLTGSTVEKAGAVSPLSGCQGGIGVQAEVSDVGNHDEICENAISGAGYASLGATHSLPHPPAPAFVRPVDIVTGPAIDALTFGNTFDGRPYHPA
jgi:hypothetical protein